MSAQQQVISIDDISADNAPTIYVAGGLGRFLDAVKAEVTAEVPDLSTRKGRERIASLAAKVSKSKSAVERPGRDYLKRLKEMPKVVEAELREFVTGMDALRDATRQPLTDWEKAEDARVDKHNDAIECIRLLTIDLDGITTEDLGDRVAQLEVVAMGDDWEEFEAEAARVKDKTLGILRAALNARQRYEAEQAELVRLREEKEARDKKDNEDRIAREAAERATREAEEKAQRERDAEAQRVRDDQAAAEKRENDLKLQVAESERRAEQAKREKLEAEQKAESNRLAALEQQKQAIEQARLDEKARADAAADEILRQERLREADKAHKGAIYKTAKEAFMQHGMTEDCARLAVKLVASGLIPAMSIKY